MATCSNLIETLHSYKVNFELQMAIAKLQESMFWFNSFVMNNLEDKLNESEAVSDTIN
jgi:hypothetical protein